MTNRRPDPRRRRERGAALVTSVLFLLLVSVVVVAYMTNVTSERAMSSNVHISSTALFAADAGVRIAEQNLANMGKKKIDSLVTIYSGSGAVIKQPTKIFPAGNILSSSTSPQFDASATITFTDSAFAAVSQVYNYVYTITSTGKKGTAGTRQLQSTGRLRLSAGRGSFADYLMLTNQHTMPDGGAIWFTTSGYFEGRMHTNTQFRFFGQPTFEDLVTQVNAKAWYYNKGNNIQLDNDHNKTIDVPNFYGGFKRSQSNIALPTNSFSQQNAALGLDPYNTTSPSNSTIRTQLGLTPGTSAPPNGIYVPNNTLSVTGGIYIHGTLDRCYAYVNGSGHQVYQLTQGSRTRTITIDRTLNTTTVVTSGSPATTNVYTGVPRGVIYTVGSISDIGGPDRSGSYVPPAIADHNQTLVVATNDIVIQNDLVYRNYDTGNSVLGLFSSNGSVRIGSGSPNDLQLNAYVMAANSSNGAFQVDGYNSGSPRGTVNLKGGITAYYYGAFGQFDSKGKTVHGYARNFRYDSRGLVPPYYPTTGTFIPNLPATHTLVWKEL